MRAFAELPRCPWRMAALLLLLALAITNIYRAATQSITHDEGVFFEWFLPGGLFQSLSVEHWNHHVLNDLLCKISVDLFGPSELAMRIPGLLGGFLYFYSVWAIAGFLFAEGFLSFLAVAFLSLNPFLLDYLCCARGYALPLGLFVYSLYQMLRFLGALGRAEGSAFLHRSAGALGLSMACNVIMIFPSAAFISTVMALLLGNSMIRKPEPVEAAAPKQKTADLRRERRARRARRSHAAAPRFGVVYGLIHFALPALALGGFFAALPKRLIEVEEGYLGPPSLSAILQPLVRLSLFHSPRGFSGLAVGITPATLVQAISAFLVPAALILLVLLGGAVARHWIALRSFDALPARDRFLLLLAGMLPLNLLLIVISRYALGQPYPELRTALYWIPLLCLAVLASLQKLASAGRAGRYGAAALAVVVGLGTIQFATQFNTRYFAEWSYCAAGRDMMKIVQREHPLSAGRRIRLGVTWQLEPVVNFYRVALGMDWTDPVTREGPEGSFDYYVLAFNDRALIEQRGLRPLLRDSLSETALARRPDF